MKITFTHYTNNNELRVSTRSFEQFVDKVKTDSKNSSVARFREHVPMLDSGYQYYKGMKTWTHVMPAAEFTKDDNGNLQFKATTGLLLLSFANITDADGVEGVKRSVAFLPSTFCVVKSADGLGVHIFVRYTDESGSIPSDEAAAEQLYKVAFADAAPVYKSVVNATLQASVPTLKDDLLMTLDETPYYNPKAVALRISKNVRRQAFEAQPAQNSMPRNTAANSNGTKERKHDSVKENIERMMDFLNSKYEFRYNTLMRYTEYMEREGWQIFQPVDPRMQKQMTLEVQLQDIRVSIKDVRNFLESNFIHNYFPIDDYLFKCHGKWDGKDHIRNLAHTVPTDNPYWEDWFYTWFIAMVDQWRNYGGRTYGNSIVPLLISKQGFNKSTFCRRLIPEELQWGYNDNLVLSEKRQVLQAMSQFLLINLDEFNQISAKVQQGFLKNLVQLPNVKTKRPYGGHVEVFPRLASFIATSNMDDVLFDPSGNRRFLGVELTGPIDVSRRPNYTQLFAQALYALDNGEKGYFDIGETQRIIEWNTKYQVEQPAEQCFLECFGITDNEQSGTYLSAAAIFNELKQKYGSGTIGNSLLSFGRKLKNINGIKRRRTNKGTEYLVIRL